MSWVSSYYIEDCIAVNNYYYPVWWNQTITVYNRYEDPITNRVSWYRTVLTNCYWKYSDERLVAGRVRMDTNQSLCRVPVNPNYRDRYEWEQLTASGNTNYFTFGEDDIIIKGEVEDTIDEYTSGQRSTDLIRKYKRLQGCMIVDFCLNNTGPGLGLEHYRVSCNQRPALKGV